MNYKDLKGYLIAVDLDNTIVTGFDNIDKESFEVLKELAKNNYIVIATGRPWRSSMYFYNIIGLNTPIINYNGAWVHSPNDPNFETTMITIDKEPLIKFLNAKKDILINAFSENKDDIYLLDDTEYIKPYLHLDGGNLHVGSFEKILDKNPNGSILFSKVGSEKELEDYVRDYYKEVRIRYWFTNETAVSELYNPITSKALALERIRKYYNIPKDKTIAIGDGHNDIEMLDFSYIGVAMGDSHPELLKYANYITKTVKESGLAYFFKNYEF